ncbi:hypothetical protein TNCT6_70000 [Streptomyces sp. 6-11-2]|nr:hypothetical protein TNCT6_70000 [Streptomyces sp. 6-11-2]
MTARRTEAHRPPGRAPTCPNQTKPHHRDRRAALMYSNHSSRSRPLHRVGFLPHLNAKAMKLRVGAWLQVVADLEGRRTREAEPQENWLVRQDKPFTKTGGSAVRTVCHHP